MFKQAFIQSIIPGFFAGALLLTAGLAASICLPEQELKACWEEQPHLVAKNLQWILVGVMRG